MWYDGLFAQLEALADGAQRRKMEAYMRDQFSFLGVKKPVLDAFLKPYLKAARREPLDWTFIGQCWDKPYREAQYAAIDYLLTHKAELSPNDLPRLTRLITEKSWWDTVDLLDNACAALVERCPALKETMLQWSCADNLWLRRVAIDFQQKYKERTDAALLERIIANNLGSSEFFINKAIGWSLRDYSKVNPDWVRGFLAQYADGLAPLSVREASKYLS